MAYKVPAVMISKGRKEIYPVQNWNEAKDIKNFPKI